MAVDEALLQSAILGTALPTLRLFAWNPACLSLGRAQPFSDVDQNAIKYLGWDVVRRPSGGRAILHIDELTYSVSGNSHEPLFQCDIVECYLRISRALVRFLTKMEIHPEVNQNRGNLPSKDAEPICFEVPSQYEITFKGRKIIGSAQSRKENGILQHGSIPLVGDISRITQALKYESDAERGEASIRVSDRASTLELILGRPVTFEECVHPFISAFEEEHQITFIPGSLSEEETQLALDLQKSKFANPEWTERV
jgi:lipoate-protein ligase A